MTPPAVTIDPSWAWAPYVPDPGAPWDLARVAHLHRRAGFAAPWAVLQRDLRDGPEASVGRLLDGEATGPDGKPASDFEALADEMARQLAPSASLTRLQGIWLYRMISTGHPLRERMTLFWHGHFATSQAKVNNPELMQRQNNLFRAHALGDFKSLLEAVGKDPAMLIWLDSTANRKAHPNENYAREVMELFTLGRGRYTEKDVQEAARAFTGRFVVRDRFQQVPAQHDGGTKTVLGQHRGVRRRRHPGHPPGPDGLRRVPLRQALPPFPQRDRPARARPDRAPGEGLPRLGLRRPRAGGDDPAVEPLPRPEVPPAAGQEPGRVRRGDGAGPRNLPADRPGRRARRGLRADGPGPLRPAERRRLGRRPRLGELDDDAGPHQPRPLPALGRGRRAGQAARIPPPWRVATGSRTPPGVARFYSDLLVQDAFDRKVGAAVEAAARKAPDIAASAREAATLVLTSPEYQLA